VTNDFREGGFGDQSSCFFFFSDPRGRSPFLSARESYFSGVFCYRDCPLPFSRSRSPSLRALRGRKRPLWMMRGPGQNWVALFFLQCVLCVRRRDFLERRGIVEEDPSAARPVPSPTVPQKETISRRSTHLPSGRARFPPDDLSRINVPSILRTDLPPGSGRRRRPLSSTPSDDRDDEFFSWRALQSPF